MFVNTLTDCLENGLDLVQIATWNDWQEGTIIEPSVEYQYRDLEAIQTLRKKYVDTRFAFTPDNLRIPDRLLRERRQFRGNAPETARLDSASTALFAGNPALAVLILDKKTGVKPSAPKSAGLNSGCIPDAWYDVLGRNSGALQKQPSHQGVYIVKNRDGSVSTRLLRKIPAN